MSSPSASISYRSLFEEPGAAIFMLATFLGRIPIAMRALGCVLLVESLTGSYGLAGLVGATQTLVSAFAAPRLGRIADVHGERVVLSWSALAHAVGITWLILAAYADTHPLVMLAGAAVIGASAVPFGSLSRAFWVQALGKGRRLERAYAMEAMMDEMGFIVGPMLVVPLSVSVHPAAGLLAALAMTLIASVIMVLRAKIPTGVRIVATDPDATEGATVIGIPGMRVLVGSLLFLGVIFGAVEIVLVAFAENLGQPNAASVLAAIFALGSLLGAIGYGAITWHAPVHRRLILAIWWMAAGAIPIVLAQSIPAMAAAVFITGLAISPGMIAASTVVEHLAPPKMLTEAFSWIGSALATGAAVGSIVAGVVLDEIGVQGGQAIGLAGGALAVLVLMVWSRHLKADVPPHHIA